MGELHFSYSHLLSIIIFSPLIGICSLFLIKSNPLLRFTATLNALFTFLLTVVLALNYNFDSADFQQVERVDWIPGLGVSYFIGVDGMSLGLMLLTTLITTLVLFLSEAVHVRLRGYLAGILLLELAILGVLSALDGFLFYVFWEFMLLPTYFLIGIWGGTHRSHAAIKFFIYTALGSLLMLVGLVSLAWFSEIQFGELTFSLQKWHELNFKPQTELLLFLAFFSAFAVKIPVFPLHTWLPETYREAPTGVTVMLAAVMSKLGIYGIIRFCYPLFPQSFQAFAPFFATLGTIGIIYGALVAYAQTDIKKIVAYSSISHLGFCVLGLAALNPEGLQGTLFQMFSHGITTAALFFIVGSVIEKTGSYEIKDFGGGATVVPQYSKILFVIILSSIGFPLTSGFIGEFLVLLGGVKSFGLWGAVPAFGIVLGAVYLLSFYRKFSFGKASPVMTELEDLSFKEGIAMSVLVCLTIILGFFPNPILKSFEPTTILSLENFSKSATTLDALKVNFTDDSLDGLKDNSNLTNEAITNQTDPNQTTVEIEEDNF